MSGRRLLLVAGVFLLVGAAALAGAGYLLDDTDGTAARDSPTGETVEVLTRVPAFRGDDPVTGDRVSLGRVEEPVVLIVWASWCGPCGRRAGALESFAQRHEDDAEVIGLDLEDEPKDARAFYERHGWTFRSLADPEGKKAARLGIDELPTTLFLDRDRLVVARVEGPATRDELERGLAEATGGG